MSEGDSIGESVHGKPSVVYRFFTRLGQVGFLWDFSDSIKAGLNAKCNEFEVGWTAEILKSVQKISFEMF